MYVINEVRTKGKRVLINHYNRNKDLPTAIVVCKDAEAATALYEYILKERYGVCDTTPQVKVPPVNGGINANITITDTPLTLWSFLGCGRRGC